MMKENINRIMNTYKGLISDLELELQKAEANNDLREVIKITYDLATVTKCYRDIRAEFDVDYKRNLKLMDQLGKAIQNDDMSKVIAIAKDMGHTQTSICRALNLNNGNLSSCAKGHKNKLSKKNRDRVYQYVWEVM